MSRNTHQKSEQHAPHTASAAHEVDIDAEFSPEISRRASLSGLRREAAAIQKRAAAAGNATETVHDAAARGIAGPTTALPHAERIQASFGGAHDVSQIQAHVGGDAAAAMGATAFASGGHVVFDQTPDLHTAAHEAAHVVQQAQGVHLYGGVGEAGDAYERHADAVADRVVAGASAGDLLGPSAAPKAAALDVQRKEAATLHGKADSSDFRGLQSAIKLVAKQLFLDADMLYRIINSNVVNDAGVAPLIGQINETVRKASSQLGPLARRIGSVSKPEQGMTTDHPLLYHHIGELNRGWELFSGAYTSATAFAAKHKYPLDAKILDMENDIQLIHGAMATQDKRQAHVQALRADIDRTPESEMFTIALRENLHATYDAARSVRSALSTNDAASLQSDLPKVKRHAAQTADLLKQSPTSQPLRTHKPTAKQALHEIELLTKEIQTHRLGPSLTQNEVFLRSVSLIQERFGR